VLAEDSKAVRSMVRRDRRQVQLRPQVKVLPQENPLKNNLKKS